MHGWFVHCPAPPPPPPTPTFMPTSRAISSCRSICSICGQRRTRRTIEGRPTSSSACSCCSASGSSCGRRAGVGSREQGVMGLLGSAPQLPRHNPTASPNPRDSHPLRRPRPTCCCRCLCPLGAPTGMRPAGGCRQGEGVRNAQGMHVRPGGAATWGAPSPMRLGQQSQASHLQRRGGAGRGVGGPAQPLDQPCKQVT